MKGSSMANRLALLRDKSEFFFLPFDHRGSFEKDLFGIEDRAPTEAESREISRYKTVIYEGFKKAIGDGVPKENAGILVDEQFGAEILKDAKENGFWTACSVEKSGQEEFDFEYGNEFREHLNSVRPDFAKVLVRYNPAGDSVVNLRQASRLKILSDFLWEEEMDFMFELLVPATPSQKFCVGNDMGRFDRELRPGLMAQALKELRMQGVEPDVWKVEGLATEEDCRKIVDQAVGSGLDYVGVIILGRGEDRETIKRWITNAAMTPGFVGFAIGRTVWEKSLVKVKEGCISRAEASEEIAKNYKLFCDLWMQVRKDQQGSSRLQVS
jgi:myo-inositol catabolism protein IolC